MSKRLRGKKQEDIDESSEDIESRLPTKQRSQPTRGAKKRPKIEDDEVKTELAPAKTSKAETPREETELPRSVWIVKCTRDGQGLRELCVHYDYDVAEKCYQKWVDRDLKWRGYDPAGIMERAFRQGGERHLSKTCDGVEGFHPETDHVSLSPQQVHKV